MSFNWQDLVALAVVFAAAGYLVKLALGAVIGKSGFRSCSSCSGCASAGGNGQEPPPSLVTIGSHPQAR